MSNSMKSLSLITTIMSTIMVLSSSSWMNMWIGMEINLMSFIPLLSESKNSMLSQGMMMYFLIQSLASMLFIMSLMMSKLHPQWMGSSITKMMINLSMMMKLGIAPFHLWFPELISKINWKMCLMLMTWQKIAPMYVLSMMIKMDTLTMIAIYMSTVIGAIGGLNQTSTRKIMAYSSINHMGWMMACAAMNKKSWMLYLMLYSFLMITMSSILYKYNILNLNQMNIFFMKNMDKMLLIMMMLSMGGIPPFMGFMPKWITIQFMIPSKEIIMMLIMVSMSLVTMSYYLRMILSMNMIMSHSQKWLINLKSSKKYSMFMLMINLILPLLILVFNF